MTTISHREPSTITPVIMSGIIAKMKAQPLPADVSLWNLELITAQSRSCMTSARHSAALAAAKMRADMIRRFEAELGQLNALEAFAAGRTQVLRIPGKQVIA